MKPFVIQKIRKGYPKPLDVAIRYYRIISALNDLKLTPKEIELLGFIAVRGTISTKATKDTFCELFDSTRFSLNNMIWKLTKRGLLVKEESRTHVNPAISLDFDSPIILQITITSEQA